MGKYRVFVAAFAGLCSCALCFVRQLSTALAVANWVHARHHLGCFGASCNDCIHPLTPFGASLVLFQHLVLAAMFVLVRASLQQHVDFALGLAFRPGPQCLRLSGAGSVSLTSGFDAGGALRQGWCSAHGKATPRSCASTPEGSTSFAPMNDSPRRAASPGLPCRVCESSD